MATGWTLEVELGALKKAPVYEDHKRGKNWAATIDLDPKAPGGLRRTFWEQGRGDFLYLVPDDALGKAVEFGADYYSGAGRRSMNRAYGVVTRADDSSLLIEKHATARQAIAAAKAMVTNQSNEQQGNGSVDAEIDRLFSTVKSKAIAAPRLRPRRPAAAEDAPGPGAVWVKEHTRNGKAVKGHWRMKKK